MLVQAINALAEFCGPRDVPELTREALGGPADVMALFGGSILAGGDALAGAIRAGAAKRYCIVGGEGHTTQTLREQVRREIPDIETEGKPEAEVFHAYLKHRHDLEVPMLETASTNCGNNITLMLDMLERHGIEAQSFILIQDAAMQRRMEAGLRKYRPKARIINYAACRAVVREQNSCLCFEHMPHGMWSMERFLTLLAGEIPRLTDDENGYGPRGKGFIAHVDIPREIREAYDILLRAYPSLSRPADPRYAG